MDVNFFLLLYKWKAVPKAIVIYAGSTHILNSDVLTLRKYIVVKLQNKIVLP